MPQASSCCAFSLATNNKSNLFNSRYSLCSVAEVQCFLHAWVPSGYALGLACYILCWIDVDDLYRACWPLLESQDPAQLVMLRAKNNFLHHYPEWFLVLRIENDRVTGKGALHPPLCSILPPLKVSELERVPNLHALTGSQMVFSLLWHAFRADTWGFITRKEKVRDQNNTLILKHLYIKT